VNSFVIFEFIKFEIYFKMSVNKMLFFCNYYQFIDVAGDACKYSKETIGE